MSAVGSLPADMLQQLFPFYMLVDDDMRIRGTGASIAKMLPDLGAGSDLRDWFELEAPSIEFSASGLRGAAAQLVVLRGITTRVVMRGQVVSSSPGSDLLLLCTPWLDDPADLAELGLGAADFALHDPIMDMLHVVQAQRAGSADLREIARLLEQRERELRAVHGELEIRYRELVEVTSARQRFLANMSHEMRTPLNGVIGSVDLLLSQPGDAGDREDGLRRIRASALALLSTVDGLLDVAGTDEGTVRSERLRWNARQLIEPIVDEHRAGAAARGVTFETSVGGDVPSAIAGDPMLVGRIVSNLVANAAEFSERGTVAVNVAAGAGDAGERGSIRLVVSSPGHPIPPDVQDRLFEPFFQADARRNRAHAGSGLGLTIARKFARQLGGDVTYARSDGRNEFILELPLRTGMAYVRDPVRLAAVEQSGLVDAPVDDRYDRITRLAAQLTGAPVALISMVLDDRQYFTSFVGLSEPWAQRRETPISHSFCRHVVGSRAPLNVPDARTDPLVCDNPAVSELGVAAYLGVPIEFDDEVVGSLCVINHEPREWSAADIDALKGLVRLLADQVTLDAGAGRIEATESKSSPVDAVDVLVVEDDEVNQVVLGKMLTRLGHRHEIASSGSEALDLMRHGSFDIVLMDLHMPGLDGIETIQAMRAQLGDRMPPTIAVTADVLPATIEECAGAGFLEVLAKPLRLAALEQCLARHAGARVARTS